MPSVPDCAQVVIVGGGIVGASIAYHLTRREITDVVVLGDVGGVLDGDVRHLPAHVTRYVGATP